MLLAGDIGGTKTLLGIFDPAKVRPRPIVVRSFGTLDYDDLTTMIAAFLKDDDMARVTIDTACFGVAGPVIGESATMTNIPWRIDARRVRSAFGFRRVTLLNDLEAMAYSIPVLEDDEVHVLQRGDAVPGGNIALIAAGTGLGQALLHSVDGRYIASPTEAGHADFAARTERELALVRDLTPRFGRVDVERVISGRGLLVLHTFTHTEPCEAGVDVEDPDAPAIMTRAALERRCSGCVEALDLFVDAYGAESGNLALRSVATGGVFVGGGIAPKILPALTAGSFMRAFNAKDPLERMVERMPVKVILNAEAGLLGAAVYAASARVAT
ncbi:MAG: glucokinase [Acidobacteria bacterium 13_1_40CM_65_14]|jgi:glucokinase|nr:MAG: glucokinase [Acidobacteria bacterium 13_1_40CM_65_14]OLC84627.1 MAG: glucokinase [Acidobacteria bacterium 13_1_40CM_4_65_8]OLD21459.1 MAG: glucokinase [Acidobacteria bacterium 13_1_40CM_3_65_5]